VNLDRGFDKVPLGQGCRTPRGATTVEYGAVVERRLAWGGGADSYDS
jgi:hypothetical protein